MFLVERGVYLFIQGVEKQKASFHGTVSASPHLPQVLCTTLIYKRWASVIFIIIFFLANCSFSATSLPKQLNSFFFFFSSQFQQLGCPLTPLQFWKLGCLFFFFFFLLFFGNLVATINFLSSTSFGHFTLSGSKNFKNPITEIQIFSPSYFLLEFW